MNERSGLNLLGIAFNDQGPRFYVPSLLYAESWYLSRGLWRGDGVVLLSRIDDNALLRFRYDNIMVREELEVAS